MRDREIVRGWEGALPSHLTRAQVARVIGITDSAVWQRCSVGSLPLLDLAGVQMIATQALLDTGSLDFPAAIAFTPAAIIDLVAEGVQAMDAGEHDRPIFSSRQLLGVYLGLSRLPWPPSLP